MICYYDSKKLEGIAAAAIVYDYCEKIRAEYIKDHLHADYAKHEPKSLQSVELVKKGDLCVREKGSDEKVYDFPDCETAWKYFYADKPMPRGLVLIMDKATGKNEYGDITMRFNLGLLAESDDPRDDVWKRIIDLDYPTLQRLLNQGDIIGRYRARVDDHFKKFAHVVNFQGEPATAINRLCAAEAIPGEGIKISYFFNGTAWGGTITRNGEGYPFLGDLPFDRTDPSEKQVAAEKPKSMRKKGAKHGKRTKPGSGAESSGESQDDQGN
jgi:hypothetical protein